ncbi:MAG: hypothetical protein COA72_01780 [Candidatus Neomarinimicrobiota bacterium]|nr:MAG: hypothetical protein COA72_01780 [Candidatus Neomarinimicrobiota bacterium]
MMGEFISEKMCAPAFLFQNNAVKPLSPRWITLKENWVLYWRSLYSPKTTLFNVDNLWKT